MTEYEMIMRLVVALLLGGLIGVERVYARKKAGVRTLGLVALGSALFVIISESVIASYGGFDIDPMRVAASVVTGVGFLGAGMIIFHKDQINNLTTAAGIWISAAIGVAVGFGMFTVAVAATTMVIITFTLMLHFENFLKRRIGRRPERIDFDGEDPV